MVKSPYGDSMVILLLQKILKEKNFLAHGSHRPIPLK